MCYADQQPRRARRVDYSAMAKGNMCKTLKRFNVSMCKTLKRFNVSWLHK